MNRRVPSARIDEVPVIGERAWSRVVPIAVELKIGAHLRERAPDTEEKAADHDDAEETPETRVTSAPRAGNESGQATEHLRYKLYAGDFKTIGRGHSRAHSFTGCRTGYWNDAIPFLSSTRV